MRVDPRRQLRVRFHESVQKRLAALDGVRRRREHRRHGLEVLQRDFSAGFEFEAGDPRLDRPRRLERSRLEQRELVGVFRRNDLHVAAARRHGNAALDQPRAAGDVLRVPELRRRDGAPDEILRRARGNVLAHDERRAAFGASADDAHAPAALNVGHDRGRGPDVAHVDRPQRQPFHGRGTGVVGLPEQFRSRGKARREPRAPFIFHLLRDERLRVRDVREIPDAQFGGIFRGALAQLERGNPVAAPDDFERAEQNHEKEDVENDFFHRA